MRAVAVIAIVFALVAPKDLFGQQSPEPQPAPAAAPAAPTAPAPAAAPRAPRPVSPAQAPRPVAPAAGTAPAAAPFVRVEPDPPGQLVNIQLDIVIATEGGTEVPFVQVRAQPLLESGKALRVGRAISPKGDRSVTVEVTATVLK